MKKLFLTLISALGVSIAAHAQAPIYQSQTLGTFICAGSAATNIGYVIDCRKQDSVALQVQQRLSTSGTDAQTLVVSRSVDGVNFGTALQSITITPVASTTSTVVTNIPTHGAGYIKIHYWTNAAASALSTNTIKYAVKISAP